MKYEMSVISPVIENNENVDTELKISQYLDKGRREPSLITLRLRKYHQNYLKLDFLCKQSLKTCIERMNYDLFV